MPITFRRLQVFVAAAQDCNFRKTADRLGISQPSISAQIRSIEQQLGYELFERRRGATSTLSVDGRGFLAHAQELLQAQRQVAAERQSIRSAQPAVLNVSVGPLLLERRVKPNLAAFHERYPDITLEFVTFNPTTDAEKAIRSGELDVLLYTGEPPQCVKGDAEIVTRVSCSIYASADMARRILRERIDFSDLPFVMPPKHYRITQWFAGQLAALGIRPRNVIARPPYMDVVRQMVADGKGVAILFDQHASECAELQAIGCTSLSAFRVMVTGRRALRPEVAPALQFLRSVARDTVTDANATRHRTVERSSQA